MWPSSLCCRPWLFPASSTRQYLRSPPRGSPLDSMEEPFCVCSALWDKWKWKWRDMWPSMVTHTQNLCSAFNPSKCTHTAVNTHTPWTHTRSSGQPFMLRRLGSSWGFGALLKDTSVVVLKVERALYIHSPHLQFLPARDSNSHDFPQGLEEESLKL